MALILKVAGADFTKNLGVALPPSDQLVGHYDFGVSAKESIINKADSSVDDGFFTGSGFNFDADSVSLPLNNDNNNFFSAPIEEKDSQTVIVALKDNPFSSLAKPPVSDGFALGTSGLTDFTLSLQANRGTATATTIFQSAGVGAAFNGPAILAGRIDGSNSQTDLTVRGESKDGVTFSGSEAGGQRNYTAIGRIDFGRASRSTGASRFHEVLIYDKALTDSELDFVFSYLRTKYF